MPRPQTKQEIYETINVERRILDEELANLEDTQMEIPGTCEKWSVKDILSHLVDWEKRCLSWYRAGLRGEVPQIPDEKFNWRQLPALNHEIFLAYKDMSLMAVKEKYEVSFKEMMAMIDGMSEEELFNPHYYKWTGNGLLRDYVNANTASHYRWASKLIRRFRKNLSDQE